MFAIDNSKKVCRSYLECIKPFIKIKCDIYAVSIPVMTVSERGDIGHEYKFTPEQQSTLDLIDQNIDQIQAQHEKMLRELDKQIYRGRSHETELQNHP